MSLRLLEPAEQELDEAIAYYNEQVTGLGEAFLLEALKVLDLIRQYPYAWHPLDKEIRWCRLNRFPYTIVYAASDAEILILSVAHMHRKPKYWKDRVNR